MSEEFPNGASGHGPTDAAGTARAVADAEHAIAPSSPVHVHHPALEVRLLEQLKHRNVIRVAILYLVVCWLILDPVHVLFHMLEVPVWANRLVVILMAIGFPAVMLFAWAYEITPDGLKPSAETDQRRSIRKLNAQRIDHAIAVVLAVGIAYLLVDKFWLSKHAAMERPAAVVAPTAPQPAAPPAIPDKSVAVLPFANMSDDQSNDYFSDGLSEELIDRLAKATELRVPARTSSFYFKGKQVPLADIAKALGVSHLIEGSVRKSGNRLRITVQLIRVDTGYHLWSETYDRKLDDIFKVQDEIAGAVVTALKASLAEGEASRQGQTLNVAAYTPYLQGRELLRRAMTQADLEQAAGHFRQALSVDPAFADGWLYLEAALNNEVISGFVTPDIVSAEMRHAAERVAALAPGSAAAHRAAAVIYSRLDWNREAAAAEYKRVYELNPNDAAAARMLADITAALGGDDRTVLSLYRQAIDLDPLWAHNYAHIGMYYSRTGRLTEADAALRKALAILPLAGWRSALCEVLIARGQPAEALAAAQSETDETARRWDLALAYQALGRRAEADAALADMEQRDGLTNASGIAEVRALRGEVDQAFDWLERGYRQHDNGLTGANQDPLLKNLHGDPRWKAFLRMMKLPEIERHDAP